MNSRKEELAEQIERIYYQTPIMANRIARIVDDICTLCNGAYSQGVLDNVKDIQNIESSFHWEKGTKEDE